MTIKPRDTCVDCRRTMAIVTTGRCGSCYGRWRVLQPERPMSQDPYSKQQRGQSRADFAGFSDMFARVEPAPRLQPHERAALTDVLRRWGHPKTKAFR